MKKEDKQRVIAYVGLGKMGLNMVQRLKEQGVTVHAWNRGAEGRVKARSLGLTVHDTLEQAISSLPLPKTIWIMVPSDVVDEMLAAIRPLLSRGDTVIDGGNSHFIKAKARAAFLAKAGIRFIDAGVSGGPNGARNGACVMVGGEPSVIIAHEWLFKTIAAPEAFLHAGTVGAGHFVKMVHNGIEYGMMQAIAEGFEVLKKSPYKLPLQKIARLYNTGSVIESRLVGWLQSGYEKFGENLKQISSVVAHTGEAAWTVDAARRLGVPVTIIAQSLKFRKQSVRRKTYTGKVLSVLRHEFGGHSFGKKKKIR